MPTPKQNVDIYRKLRLRSDLLRHAVPGACFLPFLGEGVIARHLYRGRPGITQIFGADNDPARVASAIAKFPEFKIKQFDCNGWPFPGEQSVFSMADFDAYAYPYDSFRSFMANAQLADRLVLFFTDGERHPIALNGAVFHHPDGRKLNPRNWSLRVRRRWVNFYLKMAIQPWFIKAVAGWKIECVRFYLRGMMIYYGAVISRMQPR